jgi:hypothetical protein
LVCPVLSTSHQSHQVLFEVELEQIDADSIDPCGSPVAFDFPESVPHQLGCNPARQRVSFNLLVQGKFSFPLNSKRRKTNVLRRRSPWRVFLSSEDPVRVRLGPACSRRWVIGLTFLMVFVAAVRIAADSPLVSMGGDLLRRSCHPQVPAPGVHRHAAAWSGPFHRGLIGLSCP